MVAKIPVIEGDKPDKPIKINYNVTEHQTSELNLSELEKLQKTLIHKTAIVLSGIDHLGEPFQQKPTETFSPNSEGEGSVEDQIEDFMTTFDFKKGKLNKMLNVDSRFEEENKVHEYPRAQNIESKFKPVRGVNFRGNSTYLSGGSIS